MRKGRRRQLLPAARYLLPSLLVIAVPVLHAQQVAGRGQQVADSTAFYRALDLEGAGKHREAAALFRIALHGPTAVSALLGLERAYHELQWTDSLLAPLDTLIRSNPREQVYRSVLLRSLQALGRDAEMRAAFERWAQDNPRE